MTRDLPFTALFNFRDIGGYPTADGHTVRWRRVFRSDSLHAIDETDREAFAALGVRTVVDLRRPHEIDRFGRVPPYDGLDYRHLEIAHTDWDELPDRGDTPLQRWLADRYLDFVEQGAAGVADSLAVIADADRAPTVVHCMAGKDRTGVVCALTLSLLGVADADVAADYALSTDAMLALAAHVRATDPDAGDGKPHYFSCPAEAMLLFLDELRARHGSIEGYARDAGLRPTQLDALRGHLLV